MEKKELQYKTYNDKVYFYYGENLIFQSGKSIPFIVLKKIKNDVKTSTSLYKHKINKTDDGYEIEFSSERNKAVLKLTQKENAVNFEIKCDDEYDELCFTLYKRKDYKIYGLPTYEAKEIKRTFREKLLRKKPQIINPERKLSFYVSETENPLYMRYAARVYPAPDEALMKEACAEFIGEHDFAFMQNQGTILKSTVRTVYEIYRSDYARQIQTEPENHELKITFVANGFLKQMVRNLTGLLVACGRGRINPQDIPALIESKDRRKSPPTAPAQGLTMTHIWYKNE